MRKITVAVVASFTLIAASTLAIGLGMLTPRVSAQAGSYHVLTVTSGGLTCRDMTNNLRTDRNAWRTVYYNYMAGFMTGANFVSYEVGGRDSNLPSEPHDAVFASIEQYCAAKPAKQIHEAVVRVYAQFSGDTRGLTGP